MPVSHRGHKFQVLGCVTAHESNESGDSLAGQLVANGEDGLLLQAPLPHVLLQRKKKKNKKKRCDSSVPFFSFLNQHEETHDVVIHYELKVSIIIFAVK